MNLSSSIAAASLCIASLATVPAFAQGAPCALPHPPVVGQPVYPAQPVYARPSYPAQPVYAQPGYAQPGYAQPGYAQPGVADPFAARRLFMIFAQSLRSRVVQANQRLQVGVARGMVVPQAMQAFAAQSAQLEGMLARAAQDGSLGPRERMRLDRMTANLEQLGEQFRAPAPSPAPIAYADYGRGRRWR